MRHKSTQLTGYGKADIDLTTQVQLGFCRHLWTQLKVLAHDDKNGGLGYCEICDQN